MKFKLLTNCVIVLTFGFFLASCQTVKAEPIAGPTIGMVLMHGKGGNSRHINNLAYNLRGAGVLVETPLMPWGEGRIYEKNYDDSMAEIDNIVKNLKAKGAERIVVAGHSIGANAALGYGARRDGLSGIILLAYGHIPSGNYFKKNLRTYVDKAKTMIDAGNGNEIGNYGDINQGQTKTRSMSADVYYSWFSPYGPASDQNNARNVKSGTPVLWVSGNQDGVSKYGKSLIFNKIPSHPNNEFAVISANHINTPNNSFGTVFAWLQLIGTKRASGSMLGASPARAYLVQWVAENKSTLCMSSFDKFAASLRNKIENMQNDRKIVPDFVISPFKMKRLRKDACAPA